MAYDIKGNKQYKLLPDILRRVKLRTGIRNGSFLFDKYNVKQGEKPEDIAFKWFGDAEYHWIILMTNNVTDRYYQWPMTHPQFEEFLKDKYGAGSEDGIHHYEVTQSSGPTTGDGPDDYSHKIEVNETESGAESVSNYEYETIRNEEKRNIFVLKSGFLQQFLDDIKEIMVYDESTQRIDDTTAQTENLNISMP